MPVPTGPVKYIKVIIPVESHNQLTSAIRAAIESDLKKANVNRHFPTTCAGDPYVEIETIVVTG
jgi:hypothetical protein